MPGCVLQNPFIHTAKLFHSEIAIRDALSAAVSRPGRQCEHRLSNRAVIKDKGIGERRMCGGEQSAVECGNLQPPGPTAAVSETRNRLQRFPETRRLDASFGRST